MAMYIHLVACQQPLEHQKEEEEEDLTFLPSKLGRTKILQETLWLEKKQKKMNSKQS